ncbi:unnamed protein product [Enterobius vermicularis]|uniref:Anaphase-promoting complex subunit 1 n=1 Tax=Enterobius vermicularis TaxID=51028 RepID=A0A158QAP5_ENTVE|nr:unnamed protein product [Enterobius vermicularis]
MSCVCIVGEENLQLCPDVDGHIYSVSLPFKVNKVLPCEFGLFLQRLPVPSSLKNPTVFPYLFSLSHPYDEILPIVYKSKELEGSCHYIWDSEEVSVIEVLPESNLVLCYSQSSKTHSLCSFRKVTKSEWKYAARNAESLVSFASALTPTARSFLTTTPQMSAQSVPRVRACLDLGDQAETTPLRSVRTRSMTAAAQLIESLPYPNLSPAQKGSVGRSFRDISASRWRRGSAHSTPRISSFCDDSITTAIDVRGSEIDMIAPEICIECIWIEAARRNQETLPNVPADYAFLTKVEIDGSLVLYTGVQRLGEVYLRNCLSSPSKPQSFTDSSKLGSPDAHCSERHVQSISHCTSAVFVRTAQNNNFALKSNDGLYRICRVFPIAILSYGEENGFYFLVNECLYRVASVLPNDKSMKFFTSWYLSDYNRLVLNYGGNRTVMEASLLLQFVFLQCGITIENFPYFKEADWLRRHCAEGSSEKKKQRTIAERSLAWEKMKDLDSASINKEHVHYMVTVSEDGFLYPYSLLVFGSLHLCYESAKLDSHLRCITSMFAASLHAFASIHKLETYKIFYVNDYPELLWNTYEPCEGAGSTNVSPSALVLNRFSSDKVPSFHNTFISLCNGNLCPSFGNSSFYLLPTLLVAIGFGRIRSAADLQKFAGKNWEKKFEVRGNDSESICEILDSTVLSASRKCELCARKLNITKDTLLDLPPSIALVLCELLYSGVTRSLTYFNSPPSIHFSCSIPSFEELEKIVRLRWKNDLRCNNIWQMLDSQHPTFLPSLNEAPGDALSDTEYRERQEHLLFAVSLRTLAQCFGRGLADFRYMIPSLSRTLDVPQLCLQGRSHPANMQIELPPQSESTKMMNEWGAFYNAVSAGLALGSSQAVWLDCEWLSMSASRQPSAVCAGLLYAFGLNGHIASMNLYTIHELLSGDDRLTSVGILLGYAMYKMMVTHLPFLMGPTLLELHIDPMVQTAALVSLGLLFAGSSHLGILGQLVNEIARPAVPDQEPLTDRYSYTLAAGFAIGLISLGRGEELCSNHPFEERIPSLANRLLVLIKGGLRSLCYFPTTLREPVSYPLTVTSAPQLSNHFRETENVNPHLTANAATIAFGLMYLKTGNKFAANCLQLPATLWEIEEIRPDVLLLWTLSRSLILWEDIYPSRQWVESLVPDNILLHKKSIFDSKRTGKLDSELRYVVDPESIAQAYLSIISGACFAIALRFASTSNAVAFETISFYLSLVLPEDSRENSAKELCSTAGRYICALSLNTIVYSLGILMAGSGNLQVIRICHYLRNRVLVRDAHRDAMAYSTQVATHMTLGLLILGRARYGLSTSDLSVAALVIAFFPVCPHGINDNRMYLQPLRYLWTIAAEERLLAPVCADSQIFLEAEVLFTYKIQVQCPGYESKVFNVKIAEDVAKFREIIYSNHGKMRMVVSGKNGLGTVLLATKNVMEKEEPVKDACDLQNLTKDELEALSTMRFEVITSNDLTAKRTLTLERDLDDLCSRIRFFQSDHGSLAAFDYHVSFVKASFFVDEIPYSSA